MVIAIAGWSIRPDHSGHFPAAGSHLSRFARRLDGVEINSSFYRRHRTSTFRSWAAQVPDGFRFAVKMPRAITHEQALVEASALLDAFFSDIAHLGPKLGPVLIQLPPSASYQHTVARRFFRDVRERFRGAIVCEPRHPSWATTKANDTLVDARIARVSADPPRMADRERPAGWLGERGDGVGATIYYRWHGRPRIYWSAYSEADLSRLAQELRAWPREADVWCVFDNTAAGAAVENALTLSRMFP